jgi:hypothetical protein
MGMTRMIERMAEKDKSDYTTARKKLMDMLGGILELHSENIRCTIISPGVVESELKNGTSDPSSAAFVKDLYKKIAVPADSVARAVLSAIEQPADVEIDEVVLRPTAQDAIRHRVCQEPQRQSCGHVGQRTGPVADCLLRSQRINPPYRSDADMLKNPRRLLLSSNHGFVGNRGVVVDVNFNLQLGFRWLCVQYGQIQQKGQTCEPIPRFAHVALRHASRSEDAIIVSAVWTFAAARRSLYPQLHSM